MVYEERPDTIEYGGRARMIPMLAWWCTKCEEAIFEGQPLADREKAFLELKAEVDEVLSPAEVKAAREKLGLSQRKAGELLGGGPRSFQKYEAGTQAVSTSMSHLLRLLSNDASRLQELPLTKVLISTPERKGGSSRPPPAKPHAMKAKDPKIRNAKAG